MTAAALLGDQFDDWARALARLALSTITEDHIKLATTQAANDAHHNRHKTELLAG